MKDEEKKTTFRQRRRGLYNPFLVKLLSFVMIVCIQPINEVIDEKKNIQKGLSDIDIVQLSRMPSLGRDTMWDALLVSDS
ncbi:Hypothetical predicted protein [Olea europaea subsp. europaea]|uniref:Uncharacterized protein n=1 Tax=Olea europaea subsp. europaea TaxID=158383 RepID=A0A8S0REQ8_OLEEU|nr:Hypothetical predicted protein [Olea europaea subsp. europaea]